MVVTKLITTRHITFISLIFFILLFMSLTISQPLQRCVDDNTLEITYVTTINETTVSDGNISETNKTTTETKYIYCQYGCSNNSCREGSPLNIFTFPLLLAVTFFFTFIRRDIIVNLLGSVILIVLGLYLYIYGIAYSQIIINNIITQLFAIVLICVSIYKIASVVFR